MSITLIVFLLFLFQTPVAEQPGFLGLTIGMNAQDVLRATGKPFNALQSIKAHLGHKVISDTLPITECPLYMRRSLGFDSSGTLIAVGLSYKTDSDHISNARRCALEWLKEHYGAPTGTALRDSAIQIVWKYDGVLLTLEVRNYNPHDYFVLIYYYKDE